jgi:predicted nucleic-acid-binding protein
MLVADTNVWARALLNDDASEARKARKALAEARSQGAVFVPLIVFAELAWVLRSKWERDRVLTSLEGLLMTRGIVVEAPTLAQNAIECAREGNGGLADHLIAQIGFANGAKEIITFDKAFSKAPNVRRLK